MNRDTAIGLLDRLHKAQHGFYAGFSSSSPRTSHGPSLATIASPGHTAVCRWAAGSRACARHRYRRHDRQLDTLGQCVQLALTPSCGGGLAVPKPPMRSPAGECGYRGCWRKLSTAAVSK
jgi:hypothetical protein